MKHLSFDQLNDVDIVDFLASIDIYPQAAQGNNFFYRYPLPGDPANRPIFIVNKKLNRWRKMPCKEWNQLIDLAVRLSHCTIGQLKEKLLAASSPVAQLASADMIIPEGNITIEQTHPVRSYLLKQLVWERRILAEVTQLYCVEAYFTRNAKPYLGLGFRCDAGGYELFDKRHHYRVPPHSPTLLSHQGADIAVFRHVFDLLTFASIFSSSQTDFPDFLVLNSPVPFCEVFPLLSGYHSKHLFLPNDPAGSTLTELAVASLKGCHDHRSLYNGYPTLNAWVCRIGTASKALFQPPRFDAS